MSVQNKEVPAKGKASKGKEYKKFVAKHKSRVQLKGGHMTLTPSRMDIDNITDPAARAAMLRKASRINVNSLGNFDIYYEYSHSPEEHVCFLESGNGLKLTIAGLRKCLKDITAAMVIPYLTSEEKQAEFLS